MNILTKNRILQEGDEYLVSTDSNGGLWKPIPDKDFGLQIEFTKYTSVRRPSEPESSMGTGGTPAPVQSKPTEAIMPTVAKEALEGKPLVPTTAPKPLAETYNYGLPTVVSKKAHKKMPHMKMPEPEIITIAKGDDITISYPASATGTEWIGRNGTFIAKGIRFDKRNGDIMQIRPVGQRGLAKNALIEFPTDIIPQVIDYLLRHQK